MAFFDTDLSRHRADTQSPRAFLDVSDQALSRQSCQLAISRAEHQLIDTLRTLRRDDRLLVHRLVSAMSEHARLAWLEGCPVVLAQDLMTLSGTERVMLEALRHLPAEDLAAVRRTVMVLSEIRR
jgi:hypothetical protein